MNKIAISAVIPVYNGERYIARAIDSVLRQTYPAEEIIVVDDGSRDGTESVVRGYGEKVLYIRQEQGGASAARNAGIRAARGEWIAFLDADDIWLEERLARQAEVLEKEPQLGWVTGNFITEYLREKREPREHFETHKAEKLLGGRVYWENYFEAFVMGAAGWTGTMLIRRDVLERAGMFRTGQVSSNDLDMWWRIAFIEPRIGYVITPIAVYHFGVKDSITQRHTQGAIISELLLRYVPYAKQAGQEISYKKCLCHSAKYWIPKFLSQGLIKDTKIMIDNLGRYVPIGYRIVIQGLCVWPWLTIKLLPLLKKVNRGLGGWI